MERLAANLSRAVTLVTANAGAGKTTLVSDFVRAHAPRFVWYQLDHTDADPAVFLSYIAYGIRQFVPDFGQATLAYLRQSPAEIRAAGRTSRGRAPQRSARSDRATAGHRARRLPPPRRRLRRPHGRQPAPGVSARRLTHNHRLARGPSAAAGEAPFRKGRLPASIATTCSSPAKRRKTCSAMSSVWMSRRSDWPNSASALKGGLWRYSSSARCRSANPGREGRRARSERNIESIRARRLRLLRRRGLRF